MIAQASRDFGCFEPDPHVKVVLVNPAECAENPNFRIRSLASAFRENSYSQWEVIMADILMKAVVEAYQKGEEEADISEMFNKTFICGNGKTFTPEKTQKLLVPYFENVEITDGIERVRFIGI